MGDLHGPRTGNLGLHLRPGVCTGLRSEEIVFPAAANVGPRYICTSPPPPLKAREDLVSKVGPMWRQVYSNILNSFLKVPPTDLSGPSVWMAAWGKSDSLARLAANPHTESRQSPRVRGLFWRARFFSSLHDFVYHAPWKKLRVAERLSSWTQDPSCPLCGSVETLDHALGDYLFHKVIFVVLKNIWEPLQVQGLQYECGTVPVLHSFGTPQGIAQWSALAAPGGMATLEALLTIQIRFTSLLVSREPLSEFSHVFQILHDRLIHFKHQGVVTRPGITYVESVELEERRHSKRRRKDDHKQELAAIALEQIKQAQSRGLSVIYADGLAGLVGGVGWVAGYGCHEPGLWKEANHLPTHKKQSINRAELMAVIESVRRTSTRTAAFAVATGSTYVYGGVQGVAIRWRAQQWVITKGPVLNVDL